MQVWTIRILKPAPSMEQSNVTFTGSMDAAKQEVRRIARTIGRNTGLFANETDPYCYYRYEPADDDKCCSEYCPCLHGNCTECENCVLCEDAEAAAYRSYHAPDGIGIHDGGNTDV